MVTSGNCCKCEKKNRRCIFCNIYAGKTAQKLHKFHRICNWTVDALHHGLLEFLRLHKMGCPHPAETAQDRGRQGIEVDMRRLPSLSGLEAFMHVARLGSVKSAAVELALSTPALSRRIQTLERHMG